MMEAVHRCQLGLREGTGVTESVMQGFYSYQTTFPNYPIFFKPLTSSLFTRLPCPQHGVTAHCRDDPHNHVEEANPYTETASSTPGNE